MASPSPDQTHLVPTHLRTPEVLITFAGIALSVRQFLLILIGITLSYRAWLSLAVVVWLPAGQVLRWAIALVPLCIALVLAFVSLARRSLDIWCFVVLRYALRPRLFVWRSVRWCDTGLGTKEEEASDGTLTA